jgi:hypothetical protein
MFIKKITKSNKNSDKIYVSYRLVESYSTIKGSRHRTILNLGKLDIPKGKFKLLADNIENILSNQINFFENKNDKYINELAHHYAKLIKIQEKNANKELEKKNKIIEKSNFETFDMDSVKTTKVRTIGAENIVYETLKKLELDKLFVKLGYSKTQLNKAILAIIGKVVNPGSENKIREWIKNQSGISELLKTNYTDLSNNSLYRISDKIYENKNEIENHLNIKEKELFSLKEKILLYDLTNTYLEGSGKRNKKAKFGRSKEKRNDSPLITLGLVVDELGFPKTSKIFSGNVAEPTTLIKIIKELEDNNDNQINLEQRTVLMDAGIATRENLEYLKNNGYEYVCVSRKRYKELFKDLSNLITIKENKENKIEVKVEKDGNEQILFCKSRLKSKKEISMKTQAQERFEKELENIKSSLTKERGIKKYEKIIERIGRAKGKYSSIAKYYDIIVNEKDGKATKIEYKMTKIKEENMEERYSGTYYIKTSRMDLSEKEIWELYITLTRVEESFRYLKTDLNMRPIYHQTTERTESHIFISLIAYHILNSIQTELKKSDISMSFKSLIEKMRTHAILTTEMKNIKNETIKKIYCSEPEEFHKKIYKALKISKMPLKSRQMKI